MWRRFGASILPQCDLTAKSDSLMATKVDPCPSSSLYVAGHPVTSGVRSWHGCRYANVVRSCWLKSFLSVASWIMESSEAGRFAAGG